MGYKSPYNKVGQLKPEMKNQSKSSIAMKDSGIYMQDQSPLSMSPLNAHGAGGTHPDPETTVDEFGTPIPKGFKADAKGVTGTVRPLSSTQGVNTDPSTRRERSQLVEGGLSKGEDFASGGFGKAQLIKEASQPITTRENLSAEQKKAVMQSRSYSGKKSPREVAKILNIKPTITTVKVDK
jgi:hypothetical protein